MTQARVAVALFGPQGKGSFNESGLRGALRARERGHAVQVHWIGAADTDDRAHHLRQICASGLDLLVAHGGQGDEPVALVCDEFPDMQFAVTQGHTTAANSACYEVLQEQSAFLAGVLAALHSRTGIVAHLSGERVRPGLKGRAAFAHGVRAAGNDCRLLTTFIGNQHDPERAYAVAHDLRHGGADIVFAMIDGGRDGVTQACRELDMRQIGNVLDWVERDPAVFLASAVADSGSCALQAIEDHADNRFLPRTVRRYGLENPDCVRLVCSDVVSKEHRAELAHWQHQLMSGALQPDTEYAGAEFA
ncbi:BMP family ABC transporter substrate-binding protein [Comamonadaceae bacterium G21597-S1]|nr:BMP family ABC transporter substrate-binding protein [Comamonadaceae bacterium G21597-S1]